MREHIRLRGQEVKDEQERKAKAEESGRCIG